MIFFKDFFTFKIKSTQNDNLLIVEISGLSAHSAMSVYKIFKVQQILLGEEK